MRDSEWLTKTEAAAALGVDERTIERRARAGRISAKGKPGFPTLYRAADVELLARTGSQEVQTGVLETGTTPTSNGNGAVASLRGQPSHLDGLLTQVLQAALAHLSMSPTGPTGPTNAPTGPTAAYVPKAEARAIAGVSDDALRKAVAAGEVKMRGRRYRRRDLEQL